MQSLREKIHRLLRWSEKYTKADMVYFASGNFWLSFGRVVSIASGIFLTIAFANLLSPEKFGTYKYVLAIAGFIGALSLSGLGGAVTRAVAQGKEHVVPRVTRVAILWSLPASFLALAGSLYYFWNGNITLGTGLLFIAITNPFFNVFVFAKSIPIGKKDFRRMALVGMPATIVPIAILTGTLFATQNVVIILAVYFVSNFCSGLFSYLWFLKKYRIVGKRDDVEETVTYGKHLSLMGAAGQMIANIDQLLLWHFAGPAAVAIYSFALAPVREIRNFSENIYPLVFPKFATKTIAEMKQTVPLRVLQLLGVSIAMGLVYIVTAPLIYKFVLPQYVSAVFASQLLAISLLFHPKGIVETMLLAQGNTRLRYVWVSITQGTKVVLSVILIPLYGMMGAVISVVATDAISAIAAQWVYKKLG